MTQDEVAAACTALQAQGRAVTLDTVHAQLGYGTRATVRLHLTRMEHKAARAALDTETAAALRQYGGRGLDMRTTTPDREAEAARLDTLIATRRAAGYGTQPARPPQEEGSEEERRDDTKEAKRWRRHRALIQGLVDEVLPWLPHVRSS
jgi:hypothetical protein